MQLHRMCASFGQLDNKTLTLCPGLNIIQAPNESGKSTWCAFLRAMFYGLPTRERGLLAEKNKYVPWGGAPMRGSLDLEYNGRHITLLRETRRASAPMGHFSAIYTGTADLAPHFSGSNCGELLLGVSREVWERSAFIGQSALCIDQSPDLERRIASLMSTGEEQSSYSEAQERLKKQLTRRRHHKTGLLPALENKQAALQDRLFHLRETQRQQQEAIAALQEALAQQQTAEALLYAQAAAQAHEAAALLQTAQTQAAATQQQLLCLTAHLQQRGLPAPERLRALQARIAAAAPMAEEVKAAEKALEEAFQRETQAQSRLPAQAPADPQTIALPQPPARWIPASILGAGLFLGAVLAFGMDFFSPRSPFPLFFVVFFLSVVIGLSLYGKALYKSRHTIDKAQKARTEATAALAIYASLWQAIREAGCDRESAQSRLAGSRQVLESLQSAIFDEIGAFSPGINTLHAAQAVLEEGLSHYRQLEQARSAAQQAEHAYQLAQSRLPSGPPLRQAPPCPDVSPSAAEAMRDNAQQAAQAARRTVDRLEGQLAALGDPDSLSAAWEQLQEEQRLLQEEYDALQLALEALEEANTVLQSRFSPALGAETAKIFSALTGDRWTGVQLDRMLNVTATESDSPLPRMAGLLSLGAEDQLYLALRLAICQQILPDDNPLILDDALVRFDEQRLHRALTLLLEKSRQRQILLFTCQSREAETVAKWDNVTLLHL